MSAVVLAGVIAMSFAACGNTEAPAEEAAEETAAEETVETTEEAPAETEAEAVVGDNEEVGDFPQNFMEEREQKYEFDSYDEIIALLQDDEAYAYAKVMGQDEEVLFIANEYITGYDYPAVIECFPYVKNADGKYVCGGVLNSSSTATPIAVTDDGLVLTATHTEIEESAIDPDTCGFMDMLYAYVEFAGDGTDNATYGGFVRETNSVADDGVEIAPDSSAEFEQGFADYENATIVEFTVVGQ